MIVSFSKLTLWDSLLTIFPLTLGMLGNNFSRQHFETFFLIFPENRLWYFMQLSQETICMNCQSLSSEKNKKNIMTAVCNVC